MDKTKIEEELRNKFDDEYTIKMFTNFVIEFQECFQNIVPTEEVIERIKNNIFDNIKIVENFNNQNLDGRYGNDGIVYLKRDKIQNEKYVKYLLFHEMLHAITSVRNENKEQKMMGFSYLKNCYGTGLNEAMTECLTQIRNERTEENRGDLISGYRTVVEQMRRMINVLGEEETLHYYFYEPDKFKDFINTKGMNYEEIEQSFWNLCGKDNDVYNMGNRRKLYDNSNYKIQRDARTIFSNFSNTLGEVKSLEDFENKYKKFQMYTDGNYDCINTMVITYYNSIGKDVDKLLKNGISFKEIKPVLDKLHIRFEALKTMSQVSKAFEEDKNQTAINLYDIYINNPSLYQNVFAQNYAYIFDHFKEIDSFPRDEELYDPFHYPLIGALLKDHPQIDFSDVSYYKIEEPKSKINCYLFYTSDSKIYGYTINGKEIQSYEDKENNKVFEMKVNEHCTCKLICSKNGNIGFNFDSTNEFDMEEYMKEVKFKLNRIYSEKSDMEYFINENPEDATEMKKHLKKIEERIEKRQEKSYGE